mgnify:FL=1
MGVTSVVIPVAGTTGIGFAAGADPTLGPIDLVSAVLPGFSTRAATLAITVSGTAFTSIQVQGSVDNVTYHDVVDLYHSTRTDTKFTPTTGSQLICLGMNYPWLTVKAAGGGTTSYIQSTVVI